MSNPHIHSPTTLALTLALTLLMASSCGPSERRGTATGYDGPTQIEGQAPTQDSGGDHATIIAEVQVGIRVFNSNADSIHLSCECRFEDLGHDSAEACFHGRFGLDYEAALASIFTCFHDVITALPSPPDALVQDHSRMRNSFQGYSRCVESIDTSACSGEAYSDAQSALFDCHDDHFTNVQETLQPSEEEQAQMGAWIGTMIDAAEDAGCYSYF